MNLDECPICQPVHEAILNALDFCALTNIRRLRIPNLKGITAEQRTALHVAVAEKEDELCRRAGVFEQPLKK